MAFIKSYLRSKKPFSFNYFYTTMKNPEFIKIVEVGPRDGLQNEKTIIPTNIKAEFINKLSDTGLKSIEVTSFVSKRRVPQMFDNSELFMKINKHKDVDYPCLVPNMIGLNKALGVGVQECAVFASASEGFSQRNLNCSIEKSLQNFKEVTEKAKKQGLRVRGYLSCVISCPYDGPIEPRRVALLAKILIDIGCYEVSLGDTIGVGTPGTFSAMLREVLKLVPPNKLAVHCHDTYGQGLVNIFAAITEFNIRTVDSSVSGLGGCPFAKNASGNIATEDVIYMLHNSGYETGVDLNKLIVAGEFISKHLNRNTGSKVSTAINKM